MKIREQDSEHNRKFWGEGRMVIDKDGKDVAGPFRSTEIAERISLLMNEGMSAEEAELAEKARKR